MTERPTFYRVPSPDGPMIVVVDRDGNVTISLEYAVKTRKGGEYVKAGEAIVGRDPRRRM